MRSELEELEYIERYLEGKLSQSEAQKFELEIAANPDLKQSVEAQSMLQEYLEDRGLREEVAMAHQRHSSAQGGGKFNWLRWGGIGLAAAVIGGIAWFYLSQPKEEILPEPAMEIAEVRAEGPVEQVEAEAKVESFGHPLDQQLIPVKPNRYKLQAEQGGIISDSRSGAVIRVPADALTYENGDPVTGSVDLTYVEYRDQADILASNIPMTIEEDGEQKIFNSAGMFQIRAYQEDRALKVKQGKTIEIDFNMTDSLPNTNFYQLDEETRQWKMIRPSLEIEKRPQREAVAAMDVDKRPQQEGNSGTVSSTALSQPVFRYPRPAYMSFDQMNHENWKYFFAYDFASQDRFTLDTVATFEKILKEGKERVNQPLESYPFDITLFEQRYQDFGYIGQEKASQVGTEDLPIKITPKSGTGAIANRVKIEYSQEDYPEMKYFEGMEWVVPESAGGNRSSMLNRSYRDMRILYQQGKQEFTLQLKDKNDFYEVPVRGVFPKTDPVSAQQERKRNARNHARYSGRLDRRAKAFDDDIKGRKALQNIDQQDDLRPLYALMPLFQENYNLEVKFEDWYDDVLVNRQEWVAQVNQAYSDFKRSGNKKKFIRSKFAAINAFLNDQQTDFASKDNDYRFSGLWINNERAYRPEDMAVGTDDIAPLVVAPERELVSPRFYEEPTEVVSMEKAVARMGFSEDSVGVEKYIASVEQQQKLTRVLQVSGFGIYNCDQVRRMRNPIRMLAQYRDKHTGDMIENGYTLRLIDPLVNASFIFGPQQFTCSRDAENSLLLFTTEGKCYYISPWNFQQREKLSNGTTVFGAVDITEKTKNKDDLYALLQRKSV